MPLLAISSDSKTVKGEVLGYLTGILYLSPSLALCPFSQKAGCLEACLNTAGRGGMNSVQAGRRRKTDYFHADRDAFMLELVSDIHALIRKAIREGMTPVVRLNGTSDILWETIPVTIGSVTYPNIMAVFPTVQFMDYTKIVARFGRPLPTNYDLTFSYSGADAYRASVLKAVSYGARIAVVFGDIIPDTFMGMPVVDGDSSDLRFLDPKGCIVALHAKGKAKKETGPFVVRLIPVAQVA
jgi:hypothetical protein